MLACVRLLSRMVLPVVCGDVVAIVCYVGDVSGDGGVGGGADGAGVVYVGGYGIGGVYYVGVDLVGGVVVIIVGVGVCYMVMGTNNSNNTIVYNNNKPKYKQQHK